MTILRSSMTKQIAKPGSSGSKKRKRKRKNIQRKSC
jgi:hypothetical protein